MSLGVELSMAFCLMVLGFCLQRVNALKIGMNRLQGWFFQYILPFYLFVLTATLSIDLKAALLHSSLYYGLAMLFMVVIFFILKKGHPQHVNAYAFAMSAAFSNVSVVGVPMFELLGAPKLLHTIYFILPLNAALLTILISLIQGIFQGRNINLLQLLKFPAFTYALLLGVVVSLLTGGHITYLNTIRPVVSQSVQLLIFFVLGAILASYHISSHGLKQVISLSLLKLVGMPLFIFAVIAPFDVMIAKRLMIIASLPIAFNAIGYAATFKDDSHSYVSAAVIVTTLCSLVLTPLLFILFFH